MFLDDGICPVSCRMSVYFPSRVGATSTHGQGQRMYDYLDYAAGQRLLMSSVSRQSCTAGFPYNTQNPCKGLDDGATCWSQSVAHPCIPRSLARTMACLILSRDQCSMDDQALSAPPSRPGEEERPQRKDVTCCLLPTRLVYSVRQYVQPSGCFKTPSMRSAGE